MDGETENPKKIRLFEYEGPTSSSADVEIKPDGSLELSGYDIGKWPEEFWGDADYEYWVRVKPDDKDRLLLALLQEKYGNHAQASTELMAFLKAKGIPYEFTSWV